MARSQSWDPQRYSTNARFVAELGEPLIDLLDPQPGERILDLGCGDGALTAKLLERGCEVVGVDASEALVGAAKALGLDARVMNGHELTFNNEFDGALSNAALHWMTRPDDVLAGMTKALKPGARFVGEFGGGDNVRTIVSAVETALRSRHIDPDKLNPWYFPTDAEYRVKLDNHGFTVATLLLFPRPTLLPGDIVGWLQTFCESFTSVLPANEQQRFLEEVRELLRPDLCDDHGQWSADYVRLRFTAVKR